MNMKRFVYGDDDFLRCSMFVILTSDVTVVVVARCVNFPVF